MDRLFHGDSEVFHVGVHDIQLPAELLLCPDLMLSIVTAEAALLLLLLTTTPTLMPTAIWLLK
jgi:hypothetical protein